jgi:hypothetical protein
MNVLSRLARAHKEGRLLPGIAHRIHHYRGRIHNCIIGSEDTLRRRLSLPKTSGSELPAIISSGDFSGPEGQALEAAINVAISGPSKLPDEIRAITGMSGQRYRSLINSLIEKLGHTRYLEVGSWLGSTAAAAIYGNNVEAVCIDNWSKFEGTKEKFLENMAKAQSCHSTLNLIEQDFRSVDYSTLGQFNVYFFDGPHSEVDQRDAIVGVQSCLSEPFILIVDDWNWPAVRMGTMRGLLTARYRVVASVEVRTTLDNTHPKIPSGESDWHNGYFVGLVYKSPRSRLLPKLAKQFGRIQ